MKKIATISGIIILFALVGFKLAVNKKHINEKNKAVDRSGISVPVTVSEVIEGNTESTFILPATVKPQNDVNITLNTSGKVSDVNFELGSHVVKGQVLGSLENNLKNISLKNAELLAEKANGDYQRFKELWEGKAATEMDFRNAKYNYESAMSQVAQIKQQIADASIISPITGIITKKNIDAGEFVNPGASVATVVDITKLKASVLVSEKDIYKLKEGMPALITSDVFPGKDFSGTVKYVSPAGDEAHNYEVEVAFNNDNQLLKAGTFISVRFNISGNHTALQIPKTALVEGTKNPFVYTVKGKGAEMKKITIGRDLGENVEVLSGLQQGEQVITSGQINITSSSVIEIINDSNK